jgi:hypothetical protein
MELALPISCVGMDPTGPPRGASAYPDGRDPLSARAPAFLNETGAGISLRWKIINGSVDPLTYQGDTSARAVCP